VFSTEAGASGMVLEYGVSSSCCCRTPCHTVLHAARVANYTCRSSSSTHSMQVKACAAAAVLAESLEAATWVGPCLRLMCAVAVWCMMCDELLLHASGAGVA
jgi:hypothetical protein